MGSCDDGQWTTDRGHVCLIQASTYDGAGTAVGGPGTNSLACCGSTVVASCDRLRRFLRSGLGLSLAQRLLLKNILA